MSNIEQRFTKLSSNEEDTSKLLESTNTFIIDNENSNESKTLGKSFKELHVEKMYTT